MGRLEKFREIRIIRRKMISSFFLFFMLLSAGVCAADYSVNHLMRDKGAISILTVEEKESVILINVLNYKLYLNTAYIRRDMDNLKKLLLRE